MPWPSQPDPNKQLHFLLEQIFEKIAEKNIPQQEKALIIAVAKSMISEQLKDSPRINPSELLNNNNPAFKKFLENTLVAATAASMFLVHRKAQEGKLNSLLFKYEELKEKLKNEKPPSEATKKQLQDTKNEIRNILKLYNKLEPNPNIKKKIDDILKDDTKFEEWLDRLAKNTVLAKKKKDGKSITPEEDKALAETLLNLFGIDPQHPGRITGPLPRIVGDAVGITESTHALAESKSVGFSPIRGLAEATEIEEDTPDIPDMETESDEITELDITDEITEAMQSIIDKPTSESATSSMDNLGKAIEAIENATKEIYQEKPDIYIPMTPTPPTPS